MSGWWQGLSPNEQTAWLLALAALLGAGVAALIAWVRISRVRADLEGQLAAAEAQAEAARQIADERARVFADSRAQLEASFSHLSGQALKTNSEAFLRIAGERFKVQQKEAQSQFGQQQRAFAELVKPIGQTLKNTETQIREIEKERRNAFGALEKHLQLMNQEQQALQAETRNLVQALRRPEVRGRWGEMTLRRLVELAGMVERCDFSEQVVVQGEDGGLRPDMVVHLPDDRDIVVDVKTPLDAYLTAQAASDPEARDKALALHARNVRQRVKQLADKKYWEQFENSPDFAVLFIPGDQFLTAALDRDDALLEDALRERVILATPTSLVALLRAVAFSWRQVALMENAREIRSLAEEFHKRVGVFSEHFARLQRSLQGSVDAFNKSVGSLNRQVLPSARRLTELGVAERREILSSDDIETPVRPVPDVDSSDGAAADDEE